MKLYAINSGHFKLDGGAMYGVVPKSIWNRLHPADANNMISLALRCLLIEEGNRLMLVDNGMGDKQDAKFFGHYYLHGSDTLDVSLQKAGFHRNDITDVLLSHLHFDHCGGSITRKGDRLVPAFPHATYWSNALHWDWATRPNEREKASFLKENILPIAESGQLKFIDMPKEDNSSPLLAAVPFTPGVRMRLVHGHTAGMMLPEVTYKGKTIVYMADLIPSIGHIPLPYVMAYDMFPLTTLNEKKSYLGEALEKEHILFFEHDPSVECCTLKATERGVREAERFALSEL
jgi:glyoxylase-like metal-dependent hydrolase (beta-lactamase superfamily II)